MLKEPSRKPLGQSDGRSKPENAMLTIISAVVQGYPQKSEAVGPWCLLQPRTFVLSTRNPVSRSCFLER